MSSKQITAVLAAAVVLFLGGYLIYGIAMAGFLESNTPAGLVKETPGFLWIGIGQIAGGVLLVLILGWRGDDSVAAGAKTGAVVGFLMAATFGFTNLGAMNISTLTSTLVDPFLQAVLVGAAGAVAGMMLGRQASP